VLGGGERVALRGVHDDDALFGGDVDVDVIEADAGAADDLEAAAVFEDVGGDVGAAADGEAVVVADDAGEFVHGDVGLDVDVEFAAVFEDFDAVVGELVADEDALFAVRRGGHGGGLTSGNSGLAQYRRDIPGRAKRSIYRGGTGLSSGVNGFVRSGDFP
jgi:hypothetical protein